MKNDKTFAAVIREDRNTFEISYHTESDYGCVLPWNAHTCKTVAEMATKLADMAKVYGWTITSVQHHNRQTGEYKEI